MNKLKHRNPFTAVPNALLNDSELSFKAKGIYSYLYSKPDGWVFYNDAILKETTDGLNSFQSGIKELIKANWLTKRQVVLENGRFGGIEFELMHNIEKAPTDTLKNELKSVDLPHRKNRHRKNRHRKTALHIKKDLIKKYLIKKERIIYMSFLMIYGNGTQKKKVGKKLRNILSVLLKPKPI